MKKEFLVAQFAAPAAAKAPEEDGQPGRRKDLVFYSGAEILRYDWWEDEEYTIQFSLEPKDVKLTRLNNAPLLKDHWRSIEDQVGVVENAWIEGGKAQATVRFAETPDVDDVWNKVEQGIIRNVSMGVSIGNLVLTNPKPAKGERKKYMAFDWEPYEISIVPIGGDPNANFLMSAASDETLPSEVREFLRDLYKQHLAKAGAASTADNSRSQRALAVMRLRQRQHEFSIL